MPKLLFSFLLASLLLPAQTGANGSIGGRAVAADGRGLLAMIALQWTGGSAGSARPPQLRYAPTDRTGAFQFQQVPPGKYALCAQPIAGQGRTSTEFFADSCEWNSLQHPLQLASGQTLAGVALVVPQAALLQVHIDDPGQVLSQAVSLPGLQTSARIDTEVQLFLKGPDRLMHHVPITARTPAGRDHNILIPFGVSLSLAVQSSRFTVVDDKGRAIAADIPMATATGPTLNPVRMTIAGGRP